MAGVASGEPAADSIVLWTRIALDALGRQPVKGKVPVTWELASAVGRTRTAPRRNQSPESLRFCLASCSNWEAAYFTAYKRIAEDDPWFVIHVGDYIYEGGPGTGGVRQHSNPSRWRSRATASATRSTTPTPI